MTEDAKNLMLRAKVDELRGARADRDKTLTTGGDFAPAHDRCEKLTSELMEIINDAIGGDGGGDDLSHSPVALIMKKIMPGAPTPKAYIG
jgi:hypothetical protein